MLIHHCRKAAAVLLAVSAIGAVRGDEPTAQAPKAKENQGANRDDSVVEVKPGRFDVTILAGGFVEPATSQHMFCGSKGPTKILKIAANGAKVKKGDVVCELDSSDLRDELMKQQIAVEQAKAEHLNASLVREVAEISVVEYKEGIARQDLLTIEGNIRLAESKIKRTADLLTMARDTFERVEQAFKAKGGPKDPADIVLEYEMTLHVMEATSKAKTAELEAERARGERKILVEYTIPKTTKRLESEVEKERAKELARQASWELAQAKAAKLKREIEACVWKAPIDGCVHRNAGPSAGETADASDISIDVYDPSNRPQIHAMLSLADAEKTSPNMKARIFVEGSKDRPLRGTVTDVSSRPDPPIEDGSPVYCSISIRLDDVSRDLAPYKPVTAEILTGKVLENVLRVPAGALIHHDFDENEYIVVRGRDGKDQLRAVTVGERSADRVVIKIGLKSGEKIVTRGGKRGIASMPLIDAAELLRQAGDDWERFWLLDQPTHLSPYHTHGGPVVPFPRAPAVPIFKAP